MKDKEQLYVEIIYNLLGYVDSPDGRETFKSSTADRIRKEARTVMETYYKEQTIVRPDNPKLVLTKNNELLDKYWDEIRKLFYATTANVRDSNKKYSDNICAIDNEIDDQKLRVGLGIFKKKPTCPACGSTYIHEYESTILCSTCHTCSSKK